MGLLDHLFVVVYHYINGRRIVNQYLAHQQGRQTIMQSNPNVPVAFNGRIGPQSIHHLNHFSRSATGSAPLYGPLVLDEQHHVQHSHQALAASALTIDGNIGSPFEVSHSKIDISVSLKGYRHVNC